MRDGICYLCSNRREKDKYGVYHDSEDKRQVFCKIGDVSMAEFFEAGKSGLKPDKRFFLFPADYHGETEIEHEAQRYSVYRTYESSLDTVEVYCERKAGTVRDES